jgi:hypothetical protein
MKKKLAKLVLVAVVATTTLLTVPKSAESSSCDACLKGSYGSECYACCRCLGYGFFTCVVGCGIS